MIKVAINGFGRIGRMTFRHLLESENVSVVAVNDITEPDTLVHLLKYDSVQGPFRREVRLVNDTITVDGESVRLFSEREPERLPWADLNVDIVIECTGIFRDRESAGRHLKAGAKRVVISAPAKGGDVPSVVLGVNDEVLQNAGDVISNASCTTNCAAPLIKVIHDSVGIRQGMLLTVHAYTSDQRLLDAPHSDLRRARAAALSIVPTSTGAAKAVALVIPDMKGKLDGLACRVPVPSGSFVDLTLITEEAVTLESINAHMKKAADGPMKGILQYTEDPLVSADIIGNTHSSIFDSQLTMANGHLAKICGWYDNEMGYAARLADVAERLAP